jgi:hypothetical protein
MAAVAILRLPPGHEERDLAYARESLEEHLRRSQQEGDVDEQIMAAYYLLKYELEPPERSAELIDQTLETVGRGGHPAAVRDFLEGAHDYCILRAGHVRTTGSNEDSARWLRRGRSLLDLALGNGEELDQRTTGMLGRHLDLGGSHRQAADTYARFVENGDPETVAVQTTALSEATLRLLVGDYEGVRAGLAPLLGYFADRYLTAVPPLEIAAAGFAFGRASILLAHANAHLGDLATAIRVADGEKSQRLRYRSALARHPSRESVIQLERQLLTTARGGDVGAASPESVSDDAGLGADLLLRTRLLERYRVIRPELPATLLESPSVGEISAAVEPDEAAVLLTVGDEATMLALIARGKEPLAVCKILTNWPWERWERLFATPGGWLDVLARRPGTDGPGALAHLLRESELGIGQEIVTLLGEAGLQVGRLAIVPHWWLHLIPFWAVPSLSDLAVSVFASAADLVTSRAAPRTQTEASCLVVYDPTGDLPISASEAERPALDCLSHEGDRAPVRDGRRRHCRPHDRIDLPPQRSWSLRPSGPRPLGPSRRSPGGLVPWKDPFLAWLTHVGSWQESANGERVADLPGVGRLHEQANPRNGRMERWLERGGEGTLYAMYEAGHLRRLGQLWSAGDMLVGRQRIAYRFAFLSACESGVAGAAPDIDEYGGLPVALRLGGVETLVCSRWVVSEGFAALYVDRFYEELSRYGETAALPAKPERPAGARQLRARPGRRTRVRRTARSHS